MAMKWIPDRPKESGDYWFRLGESKPPQVVTVNVDKVTFRSGKSKHIAHVQGQWGDAISSSAVPISDVSPSKLKAQTWPKLIVGILLSAIAGGGVVTFWLDANFDYIGEEKTPKIEEDLSTNPQRFSITVFPIFKNWGLRPGHIEGVEFSARELHSYPEDLKLNYCDKAPVTLLSMFSGKTIICNYVASIDPQKGLKDGVWFQVFYIVPGGHALAPVTYRFDPRPAGARPSRNP